MDKHVRKFRAKKDLFGALFVLAIFGMGLFLLVRGDLIPWPMADKFGWLFVVFGVLASWDWWATCYEIEQEELVIHSGLSHSRIAFRNIEDLQYEGGKLHVKYQELYRTRWLTLSPQDRQGFANRICGKCPWLRR